MGMLSWTATASCSLKTSPSKGLKFSKEERRPAQFDWLIATTKFPVKSKAWAQWVSKPASCERLNIQANKQMGPLLRRVRLFLRSSIQIKAASLLPWVTCCILIKGNLPFNPSTFQQLRQQRSTSSDPSSEGGGGLNAYNSSYPKTVIRLNYRQVCSVSRCSFVLIWYLNPHSKFIQCRTNSR